MSRSRIFSYRHFMLNTRVILWIIILILRFVHEVPILSMEDFKGDNHPITSLLGLILKNKTFVLAVNAIIYLFLELKDLILFHVDFSAELKMKKKN